MKVCFQLILWFSFGKGLAVWALVKNCDFSLQDFVIVRIENILLLILFTFLVFLGFATRKNKPLKVEWELETYDFVFQIHYDLMLYFVVDNCLQFYFSFYYLKLIKKN